MLQLGNIKRQVAESRDKTSAHCA